MSQDEERKDAPADASEVEKTVFVATPETTRLSSRRIVETPNGLFVIRRLRGLDLISSGTPIELPVEKITPENTEQLASELSEKIDKDERSAVKWSRFLLQQGVVSEPIHVGKIGDAATWSLTPFEGSTVLMSYRISLDREPGEGEISAFDLDDETLRSLVTAIAEFSRFTRFAGLENRLGNFRE